MENKSVKEYTKLEQYQYIQQHYNDTLKQTNLKKRLAKELGIELFEVRSLVDETNDDLTKTSFKDKR